MEPLEPPRLHPGSAATSNATARKHLQVMLAMLRDLSALAPFSLFADAAHVVGMLVVLKDDIDEYRVKHEQIRASKGWEAVPFLFGVVIYCFEGIGMILQIEESMRDKSKVLISAIIP
jgi:solute carrier family 36 (proton-coupled amino acid transporter)